MSWGTTAWGTAAWAGGQPSTAIALPPPPPAVPGGIQVVIAGMDRSQELDLRSVEITDEVNARNQAKFQLVDFSRSLHYRGGEAVRIVLGETLVFAGNIVKVQERVPLDSGVLYIDVRCVDYNALTDHHVVAFKYSVANQTLKDVVTFILSRDSGDVGERLSDEGVVILGESVQTGPVLSTIVFDYQTVKECFDQLADLTGFWWNIGYDKVLTFVDRQTFKAPIALDEAVFTGFTDLTVSRDRGQYRNIQYLRGGKDVTGLINNPPEKFKGNGEEKNFSLSLEVAETPTVVKQPGNVAQTVGIRSKDSGRQWYYQIGDKDITQDASGTALTSSETLEVSYKGFFPIILQSRNDSEIAARKLIEAGTGSATGTDVEVEDDTKINDNDLAEEKVAALLRKYGRIPAEISYKTYRRGFQAGQIQDTNLPDHGIVGDMLITDVRLSFHGFDMVTGEEVYEYTVKGTDGEFVGGWADFYRRLASKGRPFTIRENQNLLLLRTLADIIRLSDTLSTTEALGSYIDSRSRILAGRAAVGGIRQKSITDSTPDIAWGPLAGLPQDAGVS